MIRILQVFGGLDRGGSETMIMNLYRNIDRHSIQFDFIKHTDRKCDYDDEIVKLGGHIYVAPAFKIYNQLSYEKWWKDFLEQHEEYRIVHGHYFTVASVFFKVARKLGRITVGHSHNTKTTQKGIKFFLREMYIKKNEKYSSYCLACSKEAGNYLFPHRDFEVLNNAIDTPKYKYSSEAGKRIRAEFKIPDTTFLVGNIGRLTPPKNHFFIIDCFNEIHKRCGNSALMLVGKGELKDEIEARIKEYGLSGDVILTGNRDDVPDLLSAMDVFLFPSLFEGLGIAAIEAQASGLPTVCSDAVPNETNITDLIEYISLDKSAEYWAGRVLSKKNLANKTDRIKEVVDSGYDIHATTKWLQEFYLKISKE